MVLGNRCRKPFRIPVIAPVSKSPAPARRHSRPHASGIARRPCRSRDEEKLATGPILSSKIACRSKTSSTAAASPTAGNPVSPQRQTLFRPRRVTSRLPRYRLRFPATSSQYRDTHAHDLVYAATALLNVGFVLFDADDRLVMCNDAIARCMREVADKFEPVRRGRAPRIIATAYADPSNFESSRGRRMGSRKAYCQLQVANPRPLLTKQSFANGAQGAPMLSTRNCRVAIRKTCVRRTTKRQNAATWSHRPARESAASRRGAWKAIMISKGKSKAIEQELEARFWRCSPETAATGRAQDSSPMLVKHACSSAGEKLRHRLRIRRGRPKAPVQVGGGPMAICAIFERGCVDNQRRQGHRQFAIAGHYRCETH